MLILLITVSHVVKLKAQSKEDLGEKKKQIENEIKYTNRLLKETRKNKEASLNQLATFKKKINLRQRLISTINKEIKLLDKQIGENSTVIESLENDLKEIKSEYAKMIYYGYKNRSSYNRLMFIFSAKDFNQAQKRLKYLQQCNEFRQKQAALIAKTKMLLDQKVIEMEAKRADKRKLLHNKKDERESLAIEKAEQNKIYKKLYDKENQLKSELNVKQKEARKLQKAIEDIIAEEIRKAREAVKKPKGFALTPEEKKLSAIFEKNKGKLPWPVQRGIITAGFGEQEHPILKGIKINNNGIDISTNKDAITRSIFDGVVTGVIILPGANKKAVIVRHGEYFSVYGNLREVYVKKGDKVTTKQDIGLTHTDNKKFKTEAHLEIWKLTEKGTIKVDPEKWITPP
ncbi:MAG: peptidoglycan DD-metalloendopeptidase family protein [Bacteroidota bacterium]